MRRARPDFILFPGHPFSHFKSDFSQDSPIRVNDCEELQAVRARAAGYQRGVSSPGLAKS